MRTPTLPATLTWLLATVVCGAGISAPLAIDLAKSKSHVEFLAVGAPSAIKIRGRIDEDKPALKGGLKIENGSVTGTAKVALDDFDTGIALRNRHMKEKYLETGKYPEAEIELTKLVLPSTATGDAFDVEKVPFQGTLLLHGVKKPVAGTANVKRAGNDVRMTFDFRFPLAEFGVDTPSFMGIKVTDDVAVNVAINGEAGGK